MTTPTGGPPPQSADARVNLLHQDVVGLQWPVAGCPASVRAWRLFTFLPNLAVPLVAARHYPPGEVLASVLAPTEDHIAAGRNLQECVDSDAALDCDILFFGYSCRNYYLSTNSELYGGRRPRAIVWRRNTAVAGHLCAAVASPDPKARDAYVWVFDSMGLKEAHVAFTAVRDYFVSNWGFSAACVGLSKSGFGAMAIPGILLMAQVMPARESTGVILPMLILADLFAVQAFRKFTVWRILLKILPAAVIGVAVGWWLMPHIPLGLFNPVIGWIILALLLLTIAQKSSTHLQRIAADHPAVSWPLGLLAGVSTMLANAAGPVIQLYLMARKIPKMELIGIGARFFLLINLLKVPLNARLALITTDSLLENARLLPGVVLGIFGGKWLIRHVPQVAFEGMILVFSVIAGLRLLFW
jgi:uncharacterized membrane protein YfcA